MCKNLTLLFQCGKYETNMIQDATLKIRKTVFVARILLLEKLKHTRLLIMLAMVVKIFLLTSNAINLSIYEVKFFPTHS